MYCIASSRFSAFHHVYEAPDIHLTASIDNIVVEKNANERVWRSIVILESLVNISITKEKMRNDGDIWWYLLAGKRSDRCLKRAERNQIYERGGCYDAYQLETNLRDNSRYY